MVGHDPDRSCDIAPEPESHFWFRGTSHMDIRELLAHMLVEAPKIVEEARSEARLQEAKKQND